MNTYTPLWRRIHEKVEHLRQQAVNPATRELLEKAEAELGPDGIRARDKAWWDSLIATNPAFKADAERLRKSHNAATFWPEE